MGKVPVGASAAKHSNPRRRWSHAGGGSPAGQLAGRSNSNRPAGSAILWGRIGGVTVVGKNRSELDSILDELEQELPVLLKDTEDQEDFLMAFTALSDAIEDSVDPEDLPYVRKRIDEMLARHGVHLSGK